MNYILDYHLLILFGLICYRRISFTMIQISAVCVAHSQGSLSDLGIQFLGVSLLRDPHEVSNHHNLMLISMCFCQL